MIRSVPSVVLSIGFLFVAIPATFSQETAKPKEKTDQVSGGRSTAAEGADDVLTKEDRDGMSPNSVLQLLNLATSVSSPEN